MKGENVMFYVYEWFNIETQEVIYVGKGTGRRYKVRKHNRMFDDYIKRFPVDSRIVERFATEEEAFKFEYEYIFKLKENGQCVCNINPGGAGGTVSWWDDERRKQYSNYNVMKSKHQRNRMKQSNPMHNPEVAQKTAKSKTRPVIINGKQYGGVKEAAKILGVWDISIYRWVKRGYDTDGNPCHYVGEQQKNFEKKITCSKAVWVDNYKFPSVKAAADFLGTYSERIIRDIKAKKPCLGHNCRYDNQQPSRGKSDNSTTEGSTTNE